MQAANLPSTELWGCRNAKQYVLYFWINKQEEKMKNSNPNPGSFSSFFFLSITGFLDSSTFPKVGLIMLSLNPIQIAKETNAHQFGWFGFRLIVVKESQHYGTNPSRNKGLIQNKPMPVWSLLSHLLFSHELVHQDPQNTRDVLSSSNIYF